MDGKQKAAAANKDGSSSQGTRRRDISQPLVLEEVNALIRYASERGIDPGGTALAALNKVVVEYEGARQGQKAQKQGELLKHYATLTAKTAPVNGRTLLDTNQANRQLGTLALLTIVLLALVIANGIFALWFGDQIEPEEGLQLGLLYTQRYVLGYLAPFLWGGLGACVYLLKRLYDIAADRAYDRAQLKGWTLRVLLGAILGAVVVHLFDLSTLTAGGVPLEANAVAFFVGLGVKVVYGAFERMVEVLADKLNLGAIRRAQTQTTDADKATAARAAE
jgi:hypothetical protein